MDGSKLPVYVLFVLSLALGAPAQPAFAAQAVAAPTRPVYAKPLEAPDIQSDTRNLEAILSREGAPPALAPSAASPALPKPPLPSLAPSAGAPALSKPAQPAPPPPTILVMPSAQAAPANDLILPPEPENDAAAMNDMPVDDAYGWKGWTSEPTSVFTALIAFFTFILALAGGWHVYVAGATARRQLRAYVFITQTEISGVAAHTQPVSQLVIRNTGQTPAHDVVVYGNMIFDEFPLKKDLPVLVFSDPQLTKENLGPGSERYKWEYALVPLTEEQINLMNAGTHALYVYGEIRYCDVFRKKRYTKYLYYTGGNMGIRGNILGGYPEGNKAI